MQPTTQSQESHLTPFGNHHLTPDETAVCNEALETYRQQTDFYARLLTIQSRVNMAIEKHVEKQPETMGHGSSVGIPFLFFNGYSYSQIFSFHVTDDKVATIMFRTNSGEDNTIKLVYTPGVDVISKHLFVAVPI